MKYSCHEQLRLRLKKAYQDSGLSISAFASQLGIERSLMWRYLYGDGGFSFDAAIHIANSIGVDLNEIQVSCHQEVA